MGVFAGAGVRCQASQHWTVSAGLRYTDLRASVLPFLVLTYSRPIATDLTFTLTASSLERGGDYEIDRLPEVALQWNVLHRPTSVSIQVFGGSITTTSVTPHIQTSRVGFIADLSAPIRLNSSTDFTPSLRVATINYGTGANHEFWIGTAVLVVRPTARSDVGLAYLKQDSRGTSPLLFDVVNFDHTLTGWVGVVVAPMGRLGLSATANLFTAPSWTMKEYTLSWNRFGEWTASLTWRVTDGRVWLGFSFAQ